MTDIQATQVLVEQFVANDPAMQTTTILLEQWIPVATGATQMIATTMLIEQWIPVVPDAPAQQQARVMILA